MKNIDRKDSEQNKRKPRVFSRIRVFANYSSDKVIIANE